MRAAVNGDKGFAVRAEHKAIGMRRHLHLLAERGYKAPIGKNRHSSEINLHRQPARRSLQKLRI